MRISVFGLGYVGTVACGCLAHDGFSVIGVDVNALKVDLVRSGRSPIVEPRLDELIAAAVASGRLTATADPDRAVRETDLSVVSVGTPSSPGGDVDLEALRRVVQQIGAALPRKASRHIVVIRSTVLPGTVRSRVVPWLEEASGRRFDVDFGVCFNPEFMREGSSVDDHYNPPFTLIGGSNEADANAVATLYRPVNGPVLFSDLETAEMLKYACNLFHAVKVTFANEIGVLCRVLGLDSHRVMGIFRQDTRLNLSPNYLQPGFAFGGSCLPKDLRAVLHAASQHDLELPLISAIPTSNRLQIERVIERIVSLGRRSVGLVGLGFKAGTDDVRESPFVTLAEGLIAKGFSVQVYDRSIALSRLSGANRRYIERRIPNISIIMVADLASLVEESEVLVIGHALPELEELPRLCKPGQIVVDLVRVDGLERCDRISYWGVSW